MMRLPLRWTAAGLAALTLLTPAQAHEDDPKATPTALPATPGPGYRAGQGGGGSFLSGFSSSGFTLMANLTLSELDGSNQANDCWGYTSPSGREYALMCTNDSTLFIEVTNPAAPNTLFTHSTSNCIWRDVKVFGHHAYTVTECGAGIQVYDMSDIDNGNVSHVNSITDGGSNSHNVVIDTDSGYLYRVGGSGNGLKIYNLNASVTNPPNVANWSDRYVHDAQVVTYTSGPYAGKQVAFLCGGLNGGWTAPRLEILDVTDKNNIIEMGDVFYPGAEYSHQGWLSEDRQYFYLGDELDEGNLNIDSTTHVMDVSDLNNPTYAGAFDNGNPAVTHNLYTRDGYIFEANYTSGIRVFDGNVSPTNPPEIAYFDTYPANDDKNYEGLWSCYPYFASGTVLGSDRQGGLFIWETDFLGPQCDLTNYCTSGTNSSGGAATMTYVGGSSVAANDLTVQAFPVPNQPGIFYFGPNQISQSFGNGTRCVGGTVFRFPPTVGTPFGADQPIDNTSLPFGASIQPGDTWNFQFWFRDPAAGGANFDLSDGLEVIFCP